MNNDWSIAIKRDDTTRVSAINGGGSRSRVLYRDVAIGVADRRCRAAGGGNRAPIVCSCNRE